MKISKAEWIILALAGAFLLLCVGWFSGSRAVSEPFRVETERSDPLPEQQALSDAGNAETSGEKININTADMETLKILQGIGDVRAADIIAFREAHGPFRYPEDITQVKGIGEGTLEQIIDYITTGDE